MLVSVNYTYSTIYNCLGHRCFYDMSQGNSDNF